MVRALAAAVLAIAVAACASGGSTPITPGPAASAAGSPAGGASAAAETPVSAHGPSGWERGPYELTGGTYRLDWESDGGCSALYFGIVGVTNGYKESPPTAGDVALKDMLKGSRLISAVPAGTYYFNVSGVACKKYSATLTRES